MPKKKSKNMFRDYPDALTLRQLADMFGIGTKLAAEMIKNGEIEAVKIGREYRIAKINAKKNNNPHGSEPCGSVCEVYFDDTVLTLRGAEKTRFKRMLETLLTNVSDTLTVQEVAKLTGYAESTILRYINRGYIYTVKICGRYAISKKSVINYFAKDKAFKNTQKSKWHKEIISKYTNI